MLSMNPLNFFSFEDLGFYGTFGKNIQKYPLIKRKIRSLEINTGYRLVTLIELLYVKFNKSILFWIPLD